MLMNDLGMPAQVQPFEMERLKNECDGTVYRSGSVIFKDDDFQYGQNVRPTATDHPFASQIGKYEGKTKRGYSALFLLFGREQRVEFKSGDLLAA